jgi:hypothetical protein
MSIVYCSGYDVVNTTFSNRADIKKVDCLYRPWNNNSMSNAFENCYNLISVIHINENVTNMYYTFSNCTNLINIPEIPDSVGNLEGAFYQCQKISNASIISDNVVNLKKTFSNCYNLQQALEIPDSVNDMNGTFQNCVNLIYVSKISNNVTNMQETFSGCSLLVNAPVIPNSVTDMNQTFYNCVNLIGDISIYSENITNANECFGETLLNKDVYIPFQNNGVNTKTYKAFTDAGYSTTTRVNGALLIDINKEYYDIDLSEYDYTIDDNMVAHLTKYIGIKNGVIQPRIE